MKNNNCTELQASSESNGQWQGELNPTQIKLEQAIGQGGFGKVYKGSLVGHCGPVAIKAVSINQLQRSHSSPSLCLVRY